MTVALLRKSCFVPIVQGNPLIANRNARILPEWLNQIPGEESIESVSGNGAHHTKKSPAIAERDAEAIIPVRKNGKLWKDNTPRCQSEMKHCVSPKG